MNEFDTAEQNKTDNKGNKKLLFKKQINGTAYVASIEKGSNKEQVISLWKSRMPRANALGFTSETTPAKETIQQANALRNSKDNVSAVRDAETGEPLVVYRGDKSGMDRFMNKQGVFHASDSGVAAGYSSGGLYENFLNIKNPLVLDEDSFNSVRDDINDFMSDILEKDESELENDRQFQDLRNNYLAFRNEEGSAVRDFYNDFLPEVSEETGLEEFKEILLKSLHDANAFSWRQIDFRDIDILNPFIQALGYDGIVRPYDPQGQAKEKEYVTFSPNQIKSATGNAGTFRGETNNILFSVEKADNEEMANKVKAHSNSPVSSKQELKSFIDNTIANRAAPFIRLKIGLVSEDTKELLNNKFGFTIQDIDIDKDGVIHAMNKMTHNLEPYDLLNATDVINTSQEITLSPEKHQNNEVLMFKKDIDGELIILVEVRKKNGYLLVFDAWRKQKVRRRSDAVQAPPGTHVLDDSPRTVPPLSDTPGEKSSPLTDPGAYDDTAAGHILFSLAEAPAPAAFFFSLSVTSNPSSTNRFLTDSMAVRRVPVRYLFIRAAFVCKQQYLR